MFQGVFQKHVSKSKNSGNMFLKHFSFLKHGNMFLETNIFQKHVSETILRAIVKQVLWDLAAEYFL